MAVDHSSVEGRIPGLVFSTTTVPTANQVDSMFTSLAGKFLALTGEVYATDGGLDDEVLLLIGIINLAEMYPMIYSGNVSSVGQSGANYTFNIEQVNNWRRELRDILAANYADVGTDGIDCVNALSDAGYSDR
jgi:hypothetical protein